MDAYKSSITTFSDLYRYFVVYTSSLKPFIIESFGLFDQESDYTVLQYIHTSIENKEKNGKLRIPFNRRDISNIEQNKSIILTPWNQEDTIMIGCGHNDLHSHADSYCVDIDPNVNPDLVIEVGHFSMKDSMTQAKGKIKAVCLEGLLVYETPTWVSDLEYLLAEGGMVYRLNVLYNERYPQSRLSKWIPVLIKMNGLVVPYDITYTASAKYQSDFPPLKKENGVPDLTKYKYTGWTFEGDAKLLNLGYDVLCWKEQLEKNRREARWIC